MYKILQIIPSLTDGGAERFVVDLSNEFVSKGHKVIICSLYGLKERDSFFRNIIDDEVTVVSLDKKLGFDKSLIRKLKNLIKREQPDIIHTHLRSVNYLGLALLTSHKRAVVHTVHNDARKEISGKWEYHIRSFLFKNLKFNPVTISKKSHESFLDLYKSIRPVRIDNGRVFPVKTASFDEAEKYIQGMKRKFGRETKIYINVGRLTPQKNQAMLVKAFHKFISQKTNAVLLIIGSERKGVSEVIVEEMQHYLSERIEWIGIKENVTDYLHLSDYFCLSSIHEGMPISLLEAMACRALPVCTPVGGIPEMIGEYGVLSKSVTEEDYYQALVSSFHLSDLTKRTEALLNKYKNEYSIESCADSYLKLYSDLRKKKS